MILFLRLFPVIKAMESSQAEPLPPMYCFGAVKDLVEASRRAGKDEGLKENQDLITKLQDHIRILNAQLELMHIAYGQQTELYEDALKKENSAKTELCYLQKQAKGLGVQLEEVLALSKQKSQETPELLKIGQLATIAQELKKLSDS